MAQAGQVDHGGEDVVALPEVGTFVGDQDLALGRRERAEHAGRDDDAARASGEGIGVGVLVRQDDEFAVRLGGELPGVAELGPAPAYTAYQPGGAPREQGPCGDGDRDDGVG